MERLSEEELILITKEYGYNGNELKNKHYKEKGYLRNSSVSYYSFLGKLSSIYKSVTPLRVSKSVRRYEVEGRINIVDFENSNTMRKVGGNNKKSHMLMSNLFHLALSRILDENETREFTRDELYKMLFLPDQDYLIEDCDINNYFEYYLSKWKYRLYHYNKNIVRSSLNILEKNRLVKYSLKDRLYKITLTTKGDTKKIDTDILKEKIHDTYFSELENLITAKRSKDNMDEYDINEAIIFQMYMETYYYRNILTLEDYLDKYDFLFENSLIVKDIKKPIKPLPNPVQKSVSKKNSSLDSFCVYRFKNNSNEIIYVGKTSNINSRMNSHFSYDGHLPENCYDQVSKIEYKKYLNKGDMDIMELYYIGKYKPIFNSKNFYDNSLNIEDNIEWKEYFFDKT